MLEKTPCQAKKPGQRLGQTWRRLSMAGVSVEDIVFVRFPFSALSQYKLRPALVLKAGKGNFVLCRITSQAYADVQAIWLNKKIL